MNGVKAYNKGQVKTRDSHLFMGINEAASSGIGHIGRIRRI